MKILVIYNPHAGHGRAKKLLPQVQSYIEQAGIEADFLYTAYNGHGRELAAAVNLRDYQGIIASGGDGTVFEVLNGYINNPSEVKPPMGIIPNGTGNAFVRDMGYKIGDWKKAVDTLVFENIREIDVGKFTTLGEEYYFLNIIGFGFISDVNVESLKFKKMGNFAYILAVFTALVNLKSFQLTIEIDGKKIERDNIFVEISNSKYTGTTFLMAPQAKLDDGYLDVTLLNKVTRRRILKVFPTIFTGEHQQFEEVEVFKAKTIKVSTAEIMKLSADGELFGETPFEVSCLEKKLQIFWPKNSYVSTNY